MLRGEQERLVVYAKDVKSWQTKVYFIDHLFPDGGKFKASGFSTPEELAEQVYKEFREIIKYGGGNKINLELLSSEPPAMNLGGDIIPRIILVIGYRVLNGNEWGRLLTKLGRLEEICSE